MAESFETDIAERFAMAAEHLRTVVSTLKSDQLLQLYGLYKQATAGKCHTSKPNWYEFEAKGKWEAWNRLGDMAKEEAMASYVELVTELSPSWEHSPGDAPKNGWVAVSCLANEESTLKESEKDIFDRVKEGNIDKVRQYAREKNRIDVVDSEGMGLIHWASDRGNLEMVKCLLELKADVNIKDSGGQTALHYASACGHFDVVKLLLDNGARPDVLCDEGCLPIDIASEDDIRSLLKSVSI